MLFHDRLPQLQGLLIFEAAARHLSFTAAARELGSTQSAVSQQIRGLEQHLELPLFQRIYRGVKLTEEGAQLFEAVQGGFQQISQCLDQLQKSRLHQQINVATDFAFAAYWLLPRLPSFRNRYPEVDVRIITSQGEYNFQQQDIDVAIPFSTEPPANFPARRLFYEEVFPVCSPGFLEQQGPVKSHKKLASLPLLKLGAESGQGWLDWQSFFKERRSQVSPREPVMTFNNYTLLIQAAIAGQGVGLGWGHLVDELVEGGVLVAMTDFTASTNGGYFVVEPKPQEDVQAKQLFIDWLLNS